MPTADQAGRFALARAWQRQGEWGGTTLWRSMTYVGLQERVPRWTGIDVGIDAFLHVGETTYIGSEQFPRFAHAMVAQAARDPVPLAAFAARFDAWMESAGAFERALVRGHLDAREAVARFVELHLDMQPYSYVFGYGEDQVVGELVRLRALAAGLDVAQTHRAATAPPGDLGATRRIGAAPVELRPFLELVRRQAQVRTLRRELWSRVEARMLAPLETVAGPRAQELTHEEILGALRDERGPSTRELDARRRRAFLAWRAQAWLLPPEVTAELAARLAAERAPEPKELRGTVGHPGRVTGRVRIVVAPEQADGFRKGEVLVSDMTTPDLMVACGRAAAIVTDRGGMLSHAAIVSREFGIPCVLGTEHATRVLRDGDLVLVDADAGIVRLLSR